jgi:hypothetical protein
MRKPKYSFTKEQLEKVYNDAGSFYKAAKVLKVSKTTFRQQYLKVQGKCIVCGEKNDNADAITCTKCYKLRESDPDIKNCSKCQKEIHRAKGKSKLSWNKTHVCDQCKDVVSKKCIKNAYIRNRKKILDWQKTSKKYKAYQRVYRQTNEGRLIRRLSNINRKCAKVTTCSPGIKEHIQDLFSNPSKKCCYCGTTENLSVEHVRPLSRGGTHTEDNVDLACLSCNISKGNKTVTEYIDFLNEIKDNT